MNEIYFKGLWFGLNKNFKKKKKCARNLNINTTIYFLKIDNRNTNNMFQFKHATIRTR